MPRPSRLSSCLLVALLAACGGGSGGGGPAGDRLSGQLTIPNLGFGAGDSADRHDDEAAVAAHAGTLRAADRRTLRGSVALPGDPQDVLRVGLAGRMQVAIGFTATGKAVCHLFEIASGREVLRLAPGEDRVLTVAAGAFDLVVAATEHAADYRVHLHATALADPAGATDVPLPAGVEGQRSAVQARYLGAHHPMRPGEIVVMHAANAAAPVAIPGMVRAAGGGPGPIQTYTGLGPNSRKSLAQGADPAASLELETVLLAKKAEAIAGVQACSPNYTYAALAEPNDQHYPLQWHYDQIRMPLAWDITQGSTSVVVGVLDTGIVLAHPDLTGRLIAGYDFISDPASALDGDGLDADPDDPGSGGGTVPSSFHGTHVAGTIGANSNNSIGVAGVDWNCRIMPLRALGKGGSGTLSDIANGILFSARLANSSATLPPAKCDVLNMSLGGPGSATVLEQACAAASGAGVLLIAAAGNDNAGTLNYPASYASVLSVGSVGFDRKRAPYSNFASNIDIWAPGGDASVNLNGDQYPDGVLSTMADGFGPTRAATYSFLQGTSMACPHVAGVAALILAVKGGTTLGELRSLLQANSQAGAGLPNGGVLMDAHAAVTAAQGGGATSPILIATPNALTFEPDTTTATVNLANRGTGNLTLVTAKSGVAYTSGTDWVTDASPSTAGANIEYTKVDLTVDRTGLANGDYQATLVLVFTDGSVEVTARVPLVLRVGPNNQAGETLFVLLVDIDTLDTIHQTSTTAAASYVYALAGVAAGDYLLVAGTDRDNDDFIGDEGELFGVWPNTDTPQILTTAGTGAVVAALNFSLVDVVALSAKKRQAFRLLRGASPR